VSGGRIAAGLALAVGVTACGEERTTRPPVTDAARRSLSVAADPPPPTAATDAGGAPLEVPAPPRLLEAGAEPRSPRRYVASAGGAARGHLVEVRLTTRVLGDDGWSAPSPAPTLRIGLEARVEAIAGGSRLWLRPLPAELAAGGDEATRALATQAAARWTSNAGRRATVDVTPVGLLRTPTWRDLAPGAAAVDLGELWQHLLGQAVPLPDQPIGVGARWQARTRVRTGEIMVTQHGAYELVAVTPGGLEIELTLRWIGERQGLPAIDGRRAELIGSLREVRGRVKVDLSSPLPYAGTLSVETRTHVRLDLGPGVPPQDIAVEDLGTMTVAGR
jgi:hypothetical protein